MEHMAELGEIVTGFNITKQCIDYMCGKIVKIDKCSGMDIFMYISSRNILGIDRIKLSE